MVPPLISRHLFPPAISKIALKSCSYSTGKKMQEKQEINYFFHDNDANKQVSHSFLLQIDFVFNIRVDESASPILAGLRVNLTMHCSRPGMVIAVMVGVAACWFGSCILLDSRIARGRGVEQCLPLGRGFAERRVDHSLQHVELAA